MEVRHVMTSPVLTITADRPLQDAAFTMLQRRIGSLVVVDGDERAVGILSERDLLPHEPANPFDPHRRPVVAGQRLGADLATTYADVRRRRVGKVMRPLQAVLAEDDPIERALHLMLHRDLHHLPVLKHGRPVGMLSRLDLLRLFWAQPDLPVAA